MAIKSSNATSLTPEQNKNYIEHVRKIMSFPSVDLDNENEISRNLDMYFDLCAEDGVRPTTAGFAQALKMSRSNLNKMMNGELHPHVQSVLAFYYTNLEQLNEIYLIEGKIHPVSGIFLMTNSYQDWEQHATNKQQINVTHTLQLPDKELKNRYIQDAYTVNPKESSKED